MRFSKISSEVPYKLRKRINKTAEGRSGLEIYTGRNRRDYRVIMQYKTWIYLLESNPSKLDVYEEGFVVMITPDEYFGDNYPNESSVLSKNFVLGKTGFIYYGNVVELNNFPPLDNWKEVLELSTTGISEKGQTWLGDVVFNVKNAKPSKVSIICKNDKSKTKEEKEKVDQLLDSQYSHITLGKNPSQSGLGNYDFDYANRDMMDNVKMQMLYLAVKSKSIDGHSFEDYVVNNFNELETPNDARIKRSIEKKEYRKNLNKAIKSLEKQAIEKGVKEVVKAFGCAAKRAYEAGFDSIELHGAHGYLIAQFISDVTNQRTDKYADGVVFLEEVIDEVLKYFPKEKILQLRISAYEYHDLGMTPYDWASIINRFKDKLDIIDVSSGGMLLCL